MAKTHWKKLRNPDYIGAYAIDPGTEPVYTIKLVRNEMVVGADGKKEECTVMHFHENVKPMILNATNAKTVAKMVGSDYVEEWQGHRVQLFCAQVKAFGDTVEALRIRPKEPKAANAPKPDFTPSTPNWEKAVQALRDGATSLEKIREKYTLSDAHAVIMIEQATAEDGGHDAE